MDTITNISINIIDSLNEGFGYSLKIERGTELVFFASVNPASGENLNTIEDCLEVVSYYIKRQKN